MKLTIIVKDKFISVNGNGILNIEQDLSWIPTEVTAVQWNHNYGHVEYVDNRENLEIFELGIYEQALIDYNNEIERLSELQSIAESEIDYWDMLREIRTSKLTDTDWTQIADNNLSEEQVNLWQIYRQTLRDMPQYISDPKPLVLDKNHKDWPIPPSNSF
jgi:hypothetical protein